MPSHLRLRAGESKFRCQSLGVCPGGVRPGSAITHATAAVVARPIGIANRRARTPIMSRAHGGQGGHRGGRDAAVDRSCPPGQRRLVQHQPRGVDAPAASPRARGGSPRSWPAARRPCGVRRRRRAASPGIAGLRDVGVGLGGGQRAAAERLLGGQEAVDLGDVHPQQEPRVVGGVAAAVGRGAAHVAVDRRTLSIAASACSMVREGGRRRCRCSSTRPAPTGRPGSRSARRRRTSPGGGGTAGAARGRPR